jgi:hypothetical protein
MSGQIIATVKTRSREEFRVYFNDHGQIVVRIWFQAADRGWRPGKQGIELRRAILPEIIVALARAGEAGGER